jgi:hypothetical protein
MYLDITEKQNVYVNLKVMQVYNLRSVLHYPKSV